MVAVAVAVVVMERVVVAGAGRAARRWAAQQGEPDTHEMEPRLAAMRAARGTIRAPNKGMFFSEG